MVKSATIKKHQNDNWKMAPGLAKHHSEMIIDKEPDERGLLGVTFADPPEPVPEGTEACFNKCQRYTLHTLTTCWVGNCGESYCDECGRYSWGSGPVGCPCDTWPSSSGGSGHHTKNEQPKLSTKKLHKPRHRN